MPEGEDGEFRAWEMIKAVLSAPKGLTFSAFQTEHQRGLTTSLPPTSTLQGLCQDTCSSNQSPGKAAAAFPAFLTSATPGCAPGAALCSTHVVTVQRLVDSQADAGDPLEGP